MSDAAAPERTVSGLAGPTGTVGEHERETREVDIGAIFPPLSSHVLRTRYVVVDAGGSVRIHSHVDRPAFFLVVEGEMELHQSDRPQPVRLKAGDTVQAARGAAHWWLNPTGAPSLTFVADLRPRAAGAYVKEEDSAYAGAAADPWAPRESPPGLPTGTLEGFVGPTRDIGEVDTLIAEVPLAAEFPDARGIETLWMRARWIDIGPHGVVPLHDHLRRPNFLRVMHGTLTFHGPRGRQDYPAGSVILEAGPEPHWWENRGGDPVRLYAIDVYDRRAQD
jgi:quercetin dioxygenase-like cupin family protein